VFVSEKNPLIIDNLAITAFFFFLAFLPIT